MPSVQQRIILGGIAAFGAVVLVGAVCLLVFGLSAPLDGKYCEHPYCLARPVVNITEVALDYPTDSQIRLNHAQILHAHNSYHVSPRYPLFQAFAYGWPEMDELIDEYGARGLELDVRYHQSATVYHLPFIDPGTTCHCLVECLTRIREWSDAHPTHFPLFIHVDFPFGSDPLVTNRTLRAIETTIETIFCGGRLLRPSEVRFNRAGTNITWPLLSQSRGRILIYMANRSIYTGDVFFQRVRPEQLGRDKTPKFIEIVDPLTQCDDIRRLTDMGYIIEARMYDIVRQQRYLLDSSFETIRNCGAHIYNANKLRHSIREVVPYDPYAISFGDVHLECNPRISTPTCSSFNLEHGIYIGY